VDITQSKAKDERIRGMSPHFENGTIRIDRNMDELIMEYLQFPKGTKDILDALEMTVRLIVTPSAYPVGSRVHARTLGE
jgi:phage terminase large subunit-like protein